MSAGISWPKVSPHKQHDSSRHKSLCNNYTFSLTIRSRSCNLCIDATSSSARRLTTKFNEIMYFDTQSLIRVGTGASVVLDLDW
jgi:hypothetical protein